MFILRGSLADVRRYICSKLLPCSTVQKVCNELRYALQCQNPLREGWGSGWERKVNYAKIG